jgi:acyl carrier protein
MEKFLEFVAEIMEVDVSEISMETLYKEGKWDSLMMLTLVMELEAEYGVSIPMESIGGIKTMMDLYKFVE